MNRRKYHPGRPFTLTLSTFGERTANEGSVFSEAGLANRVARFFGRRRTILPLAEKLKVTLCMELLNSKRTHKDYQCDHSAWGVELVKRISSERFKLLYDIYHMQIMEGDVCDTIQENHPYFDHYHTAGVPGRHEIDDTQELHYPAIMRAIVASRSQGLRRAGIQRKKSRPDRRAPAGRSNLRRVTFSKTDSSNIKQPSKIMNRRIIP